VPPANLHGVWAKYERAVEQLQALHKELLEFGQQPHPYTIRSYEDPESGHYRWEFDPAWPAKLARRWGAIMGEIVHDLRSALDQLVWQLVILNDGTPDNGHSFPICTEKPAQGFGVEMRREWTDKRKRRHHGPLFGVSDDALALIDGGQPYKGGNSELLGQLHVLWNTDKHRTLIPMMIVAEGPTINLTNAILEDREPDRFEGNTYVVEFTVAFGDPPPDPHVDVESPTPRDIAFEDGRAIIEELRKSAEFVLINLLLPASEMFPDWAGIPPP
jgi:hypothetical protein